VAHRRLPKSKVIIWLSLVLILASAFACGGAAATPVVVEREVVKEVVKEVVVEKEVVKEVEVEVVVEKEVVKEVIKDVVVVATAVPGIPRTGPGSRDRGS